MKVLTGANFNELYPQLYADCHHRGIHARPRGQECFELRPAVFRLLHAQNGLYTGATRRLNYAFLAVETLSYIAGWGPMHANAQPSDLGKRHAELMQAINPNIGAYVNDPEVGLYGAYGPRLVQSWHYIVEKLKEDPSSRQCVASIWEPGLPDKYPKDNKDVPCTLSLSFFNEAYYGENPTLGCLAHMRSNDLNWGTPYDVAAFCAIQCAVAMALGWDVGSYTHVANSLHYYVATPPNIAAVNETEKWWTRQIPYVANVRLRVGQMIDESNSILNELHDYLLKPRTSGAVTPHRSAFHSSRESVMCARRAYWQQWCSFIRFTWNSNVHFK